jgi:NADH-quinone oxidoreductase subunit M
VALPTTNAFVGEFLLLYSLFQYHTWLAVFGALTIILAAVYLFRMVQFAFLGNVSQRTQHFADLSQTEMALFTIITLVIFGFGLFPNVVFKTALPVIETILQTAMR